MNASTWTERDTVAAEKAWAAYQQRNAVSEHMGEVAGIDPQSGEVWFGDSALQIVQHLEQADVNRPLYFVRVGNDYYLRKGARR